MPSKLFAEPARTRIFASEYLWDLITAWFCLITLESSSSLTSCHPSSHPTTVLTPTASPKP